MRLRMEKYGEAGDFGAPNGDLFIEISVLPHARFTRFDDNLETYIDISPVQAVLGTSIEIETIDKRHIDVKSPRGVQNNTALRIPGEGVKRRGHPGDLLVRIRIVTPKEVSNEERGYYEKILEIEQKNKGKKGIFSGFIGKKKDRK